MSAAEILAAVAVSSPAWALLLGVVIRRLQGKRIRP